jgi:hypothetical protein
MKSQPIIPQSQYLVIAVILGIILMSVGTIWAVVKMTAVEEITATSQVELQLEQTTYDWGTISMADGKVSADFEIANKGEEVLKIYGITTTCTCTTAQFFWEGGNSPLFSMHGRSNNVVSIDPGQTVNLKVVFDPAYHGPSGVGPATRGVLMKTNDVNRPEIQFTTQAEVTL